GGGERGGGGPAGPGREDAVGVEGVAAEVHEGAAGQLQRPAGVAVGGGGNDGAGLDPPQLPELAGGEQLPPAARDRVVQVVEAFQHGHAGRGGGVADLGGLGGVAGRRLLGEHVPGGGGGGQVPGAVEAVGQRVVDALDLGVGEHVGVGADDPLDPVGGRERLGARPVAGGHRDQGVAGGAGGGGQGQAGDPGGAEDADAQRLHARPLPGAGQHAAPVLGTGPHRGPRALDRGRPG